MRRFTDSLSRRTFLCVLGACLVGCNKSEEVSSPGIPVSLGPLSTFPEGATPVELYRVQVHRSGSSFRAVSMVCTHMTCLLTPHAGGFDCPCHGSKFGSDGRCLSGPATKDLPWFELSASPQLELLVHFDRHVPSKKVFTLPG